MQVVNIRLFNFSSTRHYGGRIIQTKAFICKARLIEKQKDNTYLCKLANACAGFKEGHLIAIQEKDFNCAD